jgi:lipopolysaccharide heptosyltransferase I
MNRILIVKLGALGDVVHAIPVAAALRRAFPSARIDWLISPKHREMLDLVPVIDRRLVLNDSRVFAAIRELRRSKYDVAIDLQGLIKSAVLARASGAPRIVGFTSRYARERAASWFYTDTHDPGGGGMYHADERHVVYTNLGVLRTLGIEPGPPEFPLDQIESAVAARVAEQTGGRYAILNAGAAWPNKRWPAARLAMVAMELRARYGLQSIAVWGPDEEGLARELVEKSSGAALLSPKTTIADVVALARGASLYVSGDTGPAHIAAAVGTPIVGIYGPTRPSRNGPWLAEDVSVSRSEVCRCHHLRYCRVKTMCLEDIQVGEVVAAVEKRMQSSQHG